MDAHAVGRLRRILNLSHSKMANVLGFGGANSKDYVADMESGARPISGPVARLLEYLNRGVWDSTSLLRLPRWVHCQDADDARDSHIIMHTEYPRFIGRCLPLLGDATQEKFVNTGMPILAMDERTGFAQMVFSFIDHPVDDQEDLLIEALRIKEASLLKNIGS